MRVEHRWNVNDSDNRGAGRETCPSATWSIACFPNTTADMPLRLTVGQSVAVQ